MNIDNGANMGESGEGTKAQAAVASGEKGGDTQQLEEPESSTTKIATKIRPRPTWESMFEELQTYKETNGNLNVPNRYGSLGTFVGNQRARYKLLLKGKPTKCMIQERANQLEALGFKWSIAAPLSWDDRMEQLKEYKKNMGTSMYHGVTGRLGIFFAINALCIGCCSSESQRRS